MIYDNKLKFLIEETIKNFINEDIYSDLIKKYPNLEMSLRKAKDEFKVHPKYFLWLAKVLDSSHEPIEDIAPLLITFDKKSQLIKNSLGAKATDINSYKSVAELSQALESLGPNKTEKRVQALNSADGDVLYSDEDWLVVMPRTTKGSCELGSGTTWCTARTQSQNLFLSYVARDNENIILFYVINKKEDSRENPNAKLSIGFIDGEAVFNKQFSGITVNAKNDGLTKNDFEKIVGNENSNKFLNLMHSKAVSVQGKHPAKKELEDLVKNPEALKAKINSFRNEEEKVDFIKLVLRNPSIPVEILIFLANEKNTDIQYLVEKNKNTPPELLDLLKKEKKIYIALRREGRMSNDPKAVNLLSKNPYKEVRVEVASNPDAPVEVLTSLTQDKAVIVRDALINNSSSTPEIYRALASDENLFVRQKVASKSKTPPDALILLAKSDDTYTKIAVASNEKSPPEALAILIDTGNRSVFISIISNPNITPETLRALYEKLLSIPDDGNSDLKMLISSHEKTPPDILTQMSKSKHTDIRKGVAGNRETPREVILELSKDKDPFVRIMVAENPRCPPELLDLLAKQEDINGHFRSSMHYAIVENRRTFSRTLAFIAQVTEDEDIKYKIAMNINTPLETLNVLTQDTSTKIKNKALETIKNLTQIKESLPKRMYLRDLIKF